MTTHHNMGRINRHVGAGLLLAREVRRMSREQLAQDLGISVERLQRLEAGEDEATSTDLHLAARALGVDVSMFFEGLVKSLATTRSEPGCGEPGLKRAVNSNLGARMRLAREVRGFSLERLAEAAAMERDRIEQIEYGEEEAAAGDLHSLARVLAVPVTYFFDGVADDAAQPSRSNGRSIVRKGPEPLFA